MDTTNAVGTDGKLSRKVISPVDAHATYPAEFFDLFGAGADLELEDEPTDLSAHTVREVADL